jgi:hypothetical protein
VDEGEDDEEDGEEEVLFEEGYPGGDALEEEPETETPADEEPETETSSGSLFRGSDATAPISLTHVWRLIAGWDFVAAVGGEFVFVNTHEDDLKEDRKARFPITLARMTSLNAANQTVSFDWFARGHTVNTSSGFDLDKQSYRFMECFQGKQADDVPWHQTDWPAKLLIPVNVEIVSRQKGAVWVSQASMMAMKNHCESFGPDRAQLTKRRSVARKNR